MDDAANVKRRRLAALEQSMRAAAVPAAPPVEPPPPVAAPPKPLLSAGGGRGAAGGSGGRRPTAPDAARGRGRGRGGRDGGRAAAPDVADVDAAYAPLAADVVAGPPGLARTPPLGRPVEWVLAEVERLLRSHPKAPGDAAALRAVIDGKLKQKYVLLDNPHAPAARDAPGASAAVAPLGRRSTAHGATDAPPSAARAPAASAREARRLGLHTIPPEARRFELYAALHSLWERHASSVLDSVAPGSSREAALAGIDLHGAMIKVVCASCPQRVGLEGICLKHTAEMLYLLSPYDVLHAVPKRGCELAFAVGDWECRVEGSTLPAPPPRPGGSTRGKRRRQANAPRAVTRA